MKTIDYHSKPYYSLDAYFKNTYGKKCYKLALDAHMTCPNRDGHIDSRGCIFCSAGGSGEFATSFDCNQSVEDQINSALLLFTGKKIGTAYVAYFQNYTNTYADITYLEKVYTKALSHPDIIGISIATRPDCLEEEKIDLLNRLRLSFPTKFIWIELGLQTIHESTATFIRRGYELKVFDEAVSALNKSSIPYIVHVIFGLPGESKEMMLETIEYLNKCKPFGIKLQLLHVLTGTDLAKYYEDKYFRVLSEQEYVDIICDCIAHLSPDICIHRITGDGPKALLIEPKWSLNKRHVLNNIHKTLKERNITQGCKLIP